MESSSKYYDNTDNEVGTLFSDMDKAVRKKMKEKEEPKTKPAEVFEGFKEKKKDKKRNSSNKQRMTYKKEEVKDYRK
tara:strand:- start:3230 stop:3460 length:231 start_codon:yes stop_codon:yes gene_type:complete